MKDCRPLPGPSARRMAGGRILIVLTHPAGPLVEFGMPAVASIIRRMPSGQHPIAADRERIRVVVQMQGGDRGSSRRRPADDAQAVLSPAKVIGPVLLPWVEERHDDARLRV